MNKAMLLFAVLFLAVATAPAATAQDQPQPAAASTKSPAPEHFYKITFVVQELNAEGKPVNSRSFATTVSTKPPSGESIRTGARIPFATGSPKPASGEELPSTWQYVDVNVNFDIHDVEEIGPHLALRVRADVSSFASPSDSRLHAPLVRHNQWDSPALLPIGKATTIFTSDSVDSKGAMQVVATATLLD